MFRVVRTYRQLSCAALADCVPIIRHVAVADNCCEVSQCMVQRCGLLNSIKLRSIVRQIAQPFVGDGSVPVHHAWEQWLSSVLLCNSQEMWCKARDTMPGNASAVAGSADYAEPVQCQALLRRLNPCKVVQSVKQTQLQHTSR